MDIESLIFEQALKKGRITTARIVRKTGFSHAYVHRIFQRLVDGGQLFKTGSTKNAKYFIASDENIRKAKDGVNAYSRVFRSKEGIDADKELTALKNRLPFTGISNNSEKIFDYAFTEIMNNAAQHSKTEKLNIAAGKKHNVLTFQIRDFGIGIFNSIKETHKLNSAEDAARELIKGTTGKGIFYSSRAADAMVIESSNKKIIFNNLLNDVFVRTINRFNGTKIMFNINADRAGNLSEILNTASGAAFTIDSVKVSVNLFCNNDKCLSRQEAKTMVAGLEKFKSIILDFRDVETIGLGFADEIFELWKQAHPEVELKIENANDDVMFMVNL